MVKYISEIVEKRKYTIYSERALGKKRVVVIGDPEDNSIDIRFYRGNELLTESSDFNDFEKLQLRLKELSYMYYGECISEQNIEIVANVCAELLKYIKDARFEHITLTGEIKCELLNSTLKG